MKKTIASLMVCCFFSSMALAQTWVDFTVSEQESPIFNVIQSTNQAVEFDVEVCGMYKRDLTEDSVIYQRINMPGAEKSRETGEPELPIIRKLIAIPECDSIIFSASITGDTSFSNYTVYPAPDYNEVQTPDSAVYVEEVFAKDDSVYSLNTYMPGVNAEIVSTGYLRGQKYAEVELYPLQFNPVTGQLNVNINYEVSLQFVNSTSDVNENTGIFNNVAANTMLNYTSSGISALINDNVQGNGTVRWITLTDPSEAYNIEADYLIICADPFFEPNNPGSEVLRIANHRACYNGFDVAILNADNVISDELGFYYEGYPNPEYKKEQRIRTCIKYIYEGANASNTYDDRLAYVLLVGDSEYQTNLGMPSSYDPNPGDSWNNDPYPSDYYFSCLTSINGNYDDVGELFIGRFCVDNNLQNGLTELHNIIDKTIFYETERTFDGWRKEAGVLVYELGSSGYHNLYLDYWEEVASSGFTVHKINDEFPNAIQNTYDVLNDGTSLFTYMGHGGKYGWYLDDGTIHISDFENNLTNNHKSPVVNAFACMTGWLDGNSDCVAEALTTYSDNKGFTGYLGSGRTTFLNYAGDEPINNPPEYFQELIPYGIFEAEAYIAGEYILFAKANVSGHNNVFAFNYFGDPALNVMAEGYQITQDVELPASVEISKEITITNGATVTIPNNGVFNLKEDGKLMIDQGATLVIEDGADFYGNTDNKITVNGTIQIGSNVKFSRLGDSGYFDGLYLMNTTATTTFTNSTFEYTRLHHYGDSLSFDNTDLTDCYTINSYNGSLNVTYSYFEDSRLYAEIDDAPTDRVATIRDNNFISSYSDTINGIDVNDYDDYFIENNTVNGYYNGIQVVNAGGGTAGTQKLAGNDITNCANYGIMVYSSTVDVTLNKVYSNEYGVRFNNRSSVDFYGNKFAGSPSETQYIYDNGRYEIYASRYSFPRKFAYNVIIDEDNQGNPNDPLVYFNVGSGITPSTRDVEHNCWGNNFDFWEDFYPQDSSLWDYQPTWCPPGVKNQSTEQSLFAEALSLFEQSNYTQAKTKFLQVVSEYPTTLYAQEALKELFRLEQFVGDDYTSLKQYYTTNETIQGDTTLQRVGDFLANKCDVELENWQPAIAWYEYHIQYPESFEDSVFAIIDLGYLYLLMENGGEKSYTGNLQQHVPYSKDQFFAKRDYLLSLLPGEKQGEEPGLENMEGLQAGKLLQNRPNPFSNKTTIYFKLEKPATVAVKVFNNMGILKYNFTNSYMPKGKHRLEISADDLASGVYYYTLEINGKKAGVKKMVVVK
ncbi:MAG: T9SS type A sorting domain-containing protein [Bacteroidales bacterium]|nr:T9SS type A sorting domain-containing protein [Bacteroidales bacterium]